MTPTTPTAPAQTKPCKVPLAHRASRLLSAGQRPDEGESLQALLDANALNLKEIIEVLISATKLLQRHHQTGQLHLGIAPEKIYVLRTDVPPDVPFGIDTLLLTDAPAQNECLASLHVGYAAPEQMRDYRARFDHRTDYFALGAILFGAVMGESPYASDGGKRYMEPDYTYDIPTSAPLLRGCDAILVKKLHTFFDQTVTLDMDARYEDDCAVITVLYDLCRYATPIPLAADVTFAEYSGVLNASIGTPSNATPALFHLAQAKATFAEGIAYLTLHLNELEQLPLGTEGAEPLRIAQICFALSSAYAQIEHPDESLRYAYQGYEITHKHYHTLHPANLHANMTLANAYFCAGDLRAASHDLNTAHIMLAKAEQEAAKQAKFNAPASTAGQD